LSDKKDEDDGVPKEVHINAHNAFSLFDKSKCSDIYYEAKVEGMEMYEQRSTRVMLRYKLDKQIID